MSNDKLRATLTELEQELLAAGTLNETTRQRLQTALAEVRLALDEPEPSAEHSQTLSGRLTQAVEEFEGSHPTLVTIIGRLADGLAQIGI